MADNTKKELRNLMIYQVFVRNYSKEGNFHGVEKDIDRIKSLGTDIVYLLPIHPIGKKNRKGVLGSPYAIRDYRTINPEYGSMEDFLSLVDSIHARGMKCIIDVVFNHTSPDSVLLKEHPEWFYKNPDGSVGNRVGDWTDVIDLDYTNDKLWDYQIKTLKYWAKYVDGFRCDVAPMIPIAFWERARREVEAVRNGCIWLAESIEEGFIRELRSRGITALSDGEIYRAFDISYDYDIFKSYNDYMKGKASLSQYLDAVRMQEWIYPDNYVKLRFLENHDQTRVHFLLPDKRALRNFTAFSFFQKGTAFVYAGQEYGAMHLPSLFDKDEISLIPCEGTDMTELIARLSGIKKDGIFTDSKYSLWDAGHDICVSLHESDNGMALGIFSLRGNSSAVDVPFSDGTYTNEIDGGKAEILHGTFSCKGEPIIIIKK